MNTPNHPIPKDSIDEWKEVLLRQLGTLYCGQSPASTTVNTEGNGTVYITGPEQWDGKKLISNKWTIDPKRIAPDDSIFITVKGSVGELFRGGNCAIGRDIYAFKPSELLNYEYVYLAIQEGVNKIILFAKGDIPGISKNHILDHKILLPNKKTQDKIVQKIEELFSELDKGIESLKTAREQLKVYRQALLKNAFEGKLTEQWRKENADKLETADQLLERISPPSQPRGGRTASIEVIEGIAALAVNKPNKELPSGWKWTPLLRVARQETGHTPSRNHHEYWNGKEYWIGIVDARLNHGKTITDTLQKITPEGLANSSARTLPKGTVILSRTASVGYVSILGKPMATSQDFVTWSCTDALLPNYLMYAIMAEGDKIRRFGKGTTHTTIYFPEIRALHIALPSIQEQTTITEFLDTKLQGIFHLSGELDAQLEKSEALRQSILKKAFSGKLVPQDPDDEPASVLLERIAAEKAAAAQATAAAKTKKTKEKAA